LRLCSGAAGRGFEDAAVSQRNALLRRLGEVVRGLRRARRWSRRALAARTGISERFLADVEGGTANPSLLRLQEMAQALGVALPALLGDIAGPAAAARRHVALLGLRGAGKSTVGPLLARRLDRAFVELDDVIEQETGLQVGEIFQVHGEAYFRAAEQRALEGQLRGDKALVLAVGGGLVTERRTFGRLLEAAVTVWLRAEPEDHWQRVLAQGDTRPMADRERAFADLRRILADREPLYRRADLTIETAGVAVAEVVERLLLELPAALKAPESTGR
jgi:XRE family aerobic/anaerobic benzoate catabolism transcriptional regulator